MSTEAEVDPIKSYHVFMFPFKWEHASSVKSNHGFDKRYDLEKFTRELIGEEGQSSASDWIRDSLQLTNDSYNEYNYFYPHVREILYDLHKDLQTQDSKNNHKLIRHFKYKLNESKDLYYCIKLVGNKKPYYLQIDSILLNLYGTGTGILSFHLRNFKYSAPDQILKINKFGRRLFPPFFDLDRQWVSTGKSNEREESDLLKMTKDYELPDAIWIGEKDAERKNAMSGSMEDFTAYYKNAAHIKNGPFHLPKFITALFPDNFFATHQKRIDGHKIYLRPVLDDRMFVVSWYGNQEKVEKLQIFHDEKIDLSGNLVSSEYAYLSSPWWYQYTFLDAGFPMCQNKEMIKQLNQNHTYARWIDEKTLYGVTRYSCMMLTKELSNKKDDKGYYKGVPSFLVGHLQTMYFKMAELCLIQRATVLSFSDEVTHVSDLTRSDRNSEEVLLRIQDIYKHYILFVNKIYFREVTAQEQGIEMYDLLQKHMRLKEDIKDLDQEIEELHNYAKMVAEDKSNYQLRNLTIIGAFFLPLGLMATIVSWPSFPTSFFELKFTDPPAYSFLSRIGLMVFASTAFTFIVDWVLALRYRRKNIGKLLYCLGFVLGGILFSTRWWLSIFY